MIKHLSFLPFLLCALAPYANAYVVHYDVTYPNHEIKHFVLEKPGQMFQFANSQWQCLINKGPTQNLQFKGKNLPVDVYELNCAHADRSSAFRAVGPGQVTIPVGSVALPFFCSDDPIVREVLHDFPGITLEDKYVVVKDSKVLPDPKIVQHGIAINCK